MIMDRKFDLNWFKLKKKKGGNLLVEKFKGRVSLGLVCFRGLGYVVLGLFF